METNSTEVFSAAVQSVFANEIDAEKHSILRKITPKDAENRMRVVRDRYEREYSNAFGSVDEVLVGVGAE